MTTISLRIPDQLNKFLDKVAIQEERSKSSLIKKAIRVYLEDLHDYNAAEESYKEYLADGIEGFNIEEVKEKLKLDN